MKVWRPIRPCGLGVINGGSVFRGTAFQGALSRLRGVLRESPCTSAVGDSRAFYARRRNGRLGRWFKSSIAHHTNFHEKALFCQAADVAASLFLFSSPATPRFRSHSWWTGSSPVHDCVRGVTALQSCDRFGDEPSRISPSPKRGVLKVS